MSVSFGVALTIPHGAMLRKQKSSRPQRYSVLRYDGGCGIVGNMNMKFTEWRKSLGLSQNAVARQYDLPISTLSRWVRRQDATPLAFAVQIARDSNGAVPCESWVE